MKKNVADALAKRSMEKLLRWAGWTCSQAVAEASKMGADLATVFCV